MPPQQQQQYMGQDPGIYQGQQLLPQFNQFNNELNGIDPQSFNGANEMYHNRQQPPIFD
jgi:hypothetical protein